MAKLRKMLGDVNDPSAVGLMALIETQSAATLARWAVGVIEEQILPIYRNYDADAATVERGIAAVQAYLAGTGTQKEVKAAVKDLTQLARQLGDNAVAQAAVRAAATACAVSYSPTGVLGYTFYALAAMVYDKVGLQESQPVYDALAAETFAQLLASLQAVAVPNEAHPVQVNWHC